MAGELFLLGEPTAQELLLGPIIDGLRQMLDSLLVAPGVIDYQPALPLAKVDVGVIQIHGIGDTRALIAV